MILLATGLPCALYADAYVYYLDTGLKDARNPVTTTGTPQPVRLILRFHDGEKESPDTVQMLRRHISETVNGSGLFHVADEAGFKVEATLSVDFEHTAPVVKNTAKSIATGLSFGLIGSAYLNSYTCIVEYRANPQASPVPGQSEHRFYIASGLKRAPKNTERLPNAASALAKMSEQMVIHALQEIAGDPALVRPAS